ncbi:MFS transporter [Bifidobacterium phasiani]|uniref:MFS transporter n=1 Tax=Bifidobacterium phasiani TaxID=2834431 RepID=A0ABS6W7I6_9BIFI|nr:MFS transporter [Bifidobacterium phasiani]MBW3082312.1 MFS transporter [Bifidobacterium phasiani]
MASLLLAIIYLAFVSLGLPDALLGSAWPTMYRQFDVPVSFAGGISMTIAACTIVSALLSDRLTLRFGAGRVTAASVAMTALALFGFSVSPNYWLLLVFALPYGLGAGGVDAALNNYAAIHFSSRHMSWLHCMWGLGATAGPYVMGFALSSGQGWQWGYRYIALVQIVLTAVLVFSLPLWKGRDDDASGGDPSDAGQTAPERRPLSVRDVLAIRGAKEILIMFFCYCAVEQTAMLWSSSYLALWHGVEAGAAAGWASLFYIGITAGRFLSGFMTMRFDDHAMIRIGQAVLAAGVVLLLLPVPGIACALTGIALVGLGCAPIYPCVIHSTPDYFGKDRSQAIVGVQMACAYVGTLLMPPLFGLIAQHVSAGLFPVYLLVILVAMVVMHERLLSLRR